MYTTETNQNCRHKVVLVLSIIICYLHSRTTVTKFAACRAIAEKKRNTLVDGSVLAAVCVCVFIGLLSKHISSNLDSIKHLKPNSKI